ncbi:hypothetical protein Hanom_Chr12g01122811 [Helianthus anomalus]
MILKKIRVNFSPSPSWTESFLLKWISQYQVQRSCSTCAYSRVSRPMFDLRFHRIVNVALDPQEAYSLSLYLNHELPPFVSLSNHPFSLHISQIHWPESVQHTPSVSLKSELSLTSLSTLQTRVLLLI